ncbi:MAG TPA: hypothetical protein VHB27_23960 [Rhodopila sp.]|uniref:hypothetical protein n=1 Tax=Rhodopila sp. TaxID=2480087 RepID=UPI002C93E1BD|nr:hypothetical protein [Rhodopila sp.]HVY18296.1 hypothetical protein [Rhodopila sp.]
MGFLPRLLLCAAALLPAGAAIAQPTLYCKTVRSVCPLSRVQPQGTQCACPDHPGIWGIVGHLGADQGVYPDLTIYPDRMMTPHPRRDDDVLRNDDLDEGDDVLAGPRRRHRRDDDP